MIYKQDRHHVYYREKEEKERIHTNTREMVTANPGTLYKGSRTGHYAIIGDNLRNSLVCIH